MRSLSAILLLAAALPAFSQVAPEVLLAQLPPPPANACDASHEELGQFRDKLGSVRHVIDDQLAKCREQEREGSKQMEGRMKAQAMEAAGISPAMAEGGKNMSREEKRALAAKSMQEQTGMSMGDAEKLKTMSKEERRAWAMGKAQTGELGAKRPRPQAAQIPGNRLSMAERQEQRQLLEAGMNMGAHLQARYAQLDREYAAVQRPEAPKRDYSSTDRSPDPICQEFTRRYREILAEHLDATRQLIKDSRRIDELAAKQYGVTAMPGAGAGGLGALRSYVDGLGGITEKFRR